MKTLTLKTLFAFLLLLALPAFGQSILANTTFSAAVADSKTQTVVVASASGINVALASDPTKNTFLYADRELMLVKAINGTTITVARGQGHTSGSPHTSGEFIFVIPAYLTTLFGQIPHGACTRGNELALPRVEPVTGTVSDCIGGQWTNGDAVQTTITLNNLLRLPDPGASALTGLETAGTAAAANTEIYCTEIDLPYSMVMTGLAVLNGTTVGTNKHFAILYDSSGNVLANSATAGTTTSGASTYQKLNFVSKYFAVGPARYFACDGLNGTTDTIRHAITTVNDNVLGGTVTAQVFGTAAKITVPSTFTTAKAPYFGIF